MQAGERLWETTGAGIHPLVMPAGAARGITTLTGTLMAVSSGGVAQTILGGLTIVVIMLVVGRRGHRPEGRPKGGFVNSTRMATAGRV